ncbi:PqiC family protein [Janthinobacterium sp.]|uniref:PqiC family protein n=1 Tax=Janthinobacterium sp. TaxID=1871054 RepID=UPI00293D81EE|nr:PqiC family protein [Janthinobacterium sp.]
MSSFRTLALSAGLCLLTACAAPQVERFYTLNGGAAPVAAPAAGAANFYVEVLAVSVPQQVSRNQLVLTASGGRVELLEQERWAGPLAAEIGQALSTAITGDLGAIDVYRTPYADKLPVYRISTNVQRFESALGRYALIDAVWSVRQLASGKVLTCRSVVNEKVEGGYDALVAGHRRALAQVAAQMAQAVRAFPADGRGC